MARTWFTADTHFRHPRVAAHRGFDTADEHDAELVRRWNATVAPNDQVWHQGDVGMGNEAAILARVAQLHGVVHLIGGNHDAVWSGHRHAHTRLAAWLQTFTTVQAFARRRMHGNDVLLSHFPYRGDHTEHERYAEYRLQDTGKVLLHGHVHDAWRIRDNQINVGVDVWGLRPVSIDTITEIVHRITTGQPVATVVDELAQAARTTTGEMVPAALLRAALDQH
jgi:calcineurin-like phosphoesterase family protein